jgi:hypothetical protein
MSLASDVLNKYGPGLGRVPRRSEEHVMTISGVHYVWCPVGGVPKLQPEPEVL